MNSAMRRHNQHSTQGFRCGLALGEGAEWKRAHGPLQTGRAGRTA